LDGSSHKNGTGIGVVIISPKNVPTTYKLRLNQLCSNNEAEHNALIAGLKILLELGAKSVEIKGDSKLVLNQLPKEYKCAKESLIMYYAAVNALLKRFTHIVIQHVLRRENQEANDLAQTASGYKFLKEQMQEPIEIRSKYNSREASPKKLLIQKLGGGGGQVCPMDTHKVRIWSKFLLLTI